jgi:hypothetical protein
MIIILFQCYHNNTVNPGGATANIVTGKNNTIMPAAQFKAGYAVLPAIIRKRGTKTPP